MKLVKLNFRETTSTSINDVPKVKCFGNSPRCLHVYLPTRVNQDFCLKCLEHYDPKGQYGHVNLKDVKYTKVKIVLEI